MKLAYQLGLFTDGYDGDVSNTVDAADASYASNIGEALLVAHRSDQEFDSELSAFYYVRVVATPTPRPTAYDARSLGIEMSSDTKMQVEDRAYTLPICYPPKG